MQPSDIYYGHPNFSFPHLQGQPCLVSPQFTFLNGHFPPYLASPSLFYNDNSFSKPILKDAACQTVNNETSHVDEPSQYPLSIQNKSEHDLQMKEPLSTNISSLSSSDINFSDMDNIITLRYWAVVNIHPDGTCCVTGYNKVSLGLIYSNPIMSVRKQGNVVFDGSSYFRLNGPMCWEIYQELYPQLRKIVLSTDIITAFSSGFPHCHWRSWTQGLYLFLTQYINTIEKCDAKSSTDVKNVDLDSMCSCRCQVTTSPNSLPDNDREIHDTSMISNASDLDSELYTFMDKVRQHWLGNHIHVIKSGDKAAPDASSSSMVSAAFSQRDGEQSTDNPVFFSGSRIIPLLNSSQTGQHTQRMRRRKKLPAPVMALYRRRKKSIEEGEALDKSGSPSIKLSSCHHSKRDARRSAQESTSSPLSNPRFLRQRIRDPNMNPNPSPKRLRYKRGRDSLRNRSARYSSQQSSPIAPDEEDTETIPSVSMMGSPSSIESEQHFPHSQTATLDPPIRHEFEKPSKKQPSSTTKKRHQTALPLPIDDKDEYHKLYLASGGVMDVRNLRRTRSGRLSVPRRDFLHRQDVVISSDGLWVEHGELNMTFSSLIDD